MRIEIDIEFVQAVTTLVKSTQVRRKKRLMHFVSEG